MIIMWLLITWHWFLHWMWAFGLGFGIASIAIQIWAQRGGDLAMMLRHLAILLLALSFLRFIVWMITL